jgi:hypothetical protein
MQAAVHGVNPQTSPARKMTARIIAIPSMQFGGSHDAFHELEVRSDCAAALERRPLRAGLVHLDLQQPRRLLDGLP